MFVAAACYARSAGARAVSIAFVSLHPAPELMLHWLLIAMYVVAPAAGFAQQYWKLKDGSPRPVPRQQGELAGLRKEYGLDSVKWQRLPKSFALEPSSCANASDDAVAAFVARYQFGWTQAESIEGSKKHPGNKKHRAAQEAIRSFGPQHYYEDPLHRASGSGFGSDLGEMTNADRDWLVKIITTFNVTTMIDVPCGDVNWQMGSWETDSLTAYIGLDIVPHLIQLNSARFAHHSNKRFAQWDFAACALPKIAWPNESPQPADLVHARHVLQHMPVSRAAKAAYHLVASGARLVLVSGANSSQPHDKRRPAAARNVREGEMWNNDMGSAPFHFPSSVSCSKFGMCAYEFDVASRAQWIARFRERELHIPAQG